MNGPNTKKKTKYEIKIVIKYLLYNLYFKKFKVKHDK